MSDPAIILTSDTTRIVWSCMKVQLKVAIFTNMVDWPRKLMEPWASNMSNREYLRNMVEFMPSRL